MELMSQNNFINLLAKKGFFQYLLAKYRPFIFIKPTMFLQCFESDIKWYKQHFAKIVYAVYENWLEDHDYEDFLVSRGCVEIMSAQPEWKSIYQLFMDSLYDYKPRIRKQIVVNPMFFEMEKHFSCEK